jgi:predicted transcriptional regulator with HTH domain
MPCRVLSTKVQYATDITLIIKSIPENLKGVFFSFGVAVGGGESIVNAPRVEKREI